MQSTWNSWPHGRLITWLTPSTYSSRHTTHSTCLLMYFFHSLETLAPFSCSGARVELRGISVGLEDALRIRLLDSGAPVMVLDRGRGCEDEEDRSGVVGDELTGVAALGDELDDATVW